MRRIGVLVLGQLGIVFGRLGFGVVVGGGILCGCHFSSRGGGYS